MFVKDPATGKSFQDATASRHEAVQCDTLPPTDPSTGDDFQPLPRPISTIDRERFIVDL